MINSGDEILTTLPLGRGHEGILRGVGWPGGPYSHPVLSGELGAGNSIRGVGQSPQGLTGIFSRIGDSYSLLSW